MVVSCSAVNCTNRWGKIKEDGRKLQFHRFPLKKPVLLKKWLLAMRRSRWEPSSSSVLCAEHFVQENYRSNSQRYLKEDSVPSIFNFTEHLQRVEKKHQIIFKPPVTPPCSSKASCQKAENNEEKKKNSESAELSATPTQPPCSSKANCQEAENKEEKKKKTENSEFSATLTEGLPIEENRLEANCFSSNSICSSTSQWTILKKRKSSTNFKSKRKKIDEDEKKEKIETQKNTLKSIQRIEQQNNLIIEGLQNLNTNVRTMTASLNTIVLLMAKALNVKIAGT